MPLSEDSKSTSSEDATMADGAEKGYSLGRCPQATPIRSICRERGSTLVREAEELTWMRATSSSSDRADSYAMRPE